jgi:hypothetical protein
MAMTEPGPLVRAVLVPVGEQLGVDALLEIVDPKPGRSSAAFHFAYCGANLLLAYREPRDFPAYGRWPRRRGARWITGSFSEERGRRAAIFLAHALGTFLLEEARRNGQLEMSKRQTDCLQLLQERLPLNGEDAHLLDTYRQEYNVMDTKLLPDNVRDGVEAGTGYHLALSNPEFTGGKDPDDVPELVEAQRHYASRYFRLMADLHAVAIAIGPDRFERIRADLIRPVDLRADVLVYDRADLRWWSDVAKDWQDFAALAFG